jgi:uncharacterized protein (TIGR02246 family)
MADSDRRSDEHAIRELLDRQAMGWAAGDADAYASVFTPDADYVTFLGSHYKGRAAIAASYAPLFKKFLKGSRLGFEITQLRFLTPDVALIHAKGGRTPRIGPGLVRVVHSVGVGVRSVAGAWSRRWQVAWSDDPWQPGGGLPRVRRCDEPCR